MHILEGPPDPAYLRQLMHFLSVARAGGFRKAAALARVQQPTLSKSVAELETRLQQAVFIRSTNKLELTPLGRRLLQRCEAIEALIQSPVTDEPAELGGEVRIATQEHVATHLLPRVVMALSIPHPNLAVRITTGAGKLLLPSVESGGTDFALLFSYPQSKQFTRRAVGRFPCRIVVGKPYERDAGVLRRFIGSREIDDTDNRAFPTLAHLQRRDAKTSIAISCNSLEAHKRMVLAGAGVSILPEFMIRSELNDGSLALVDSSYVYQARLDLVRFNARRPTPQAKAALSLLNLLVP